nr:FAD-dependent monooxygenase [Virgisporangium aliadipatigenens]
MPTVGELPVRAIAGPVGSSLAIDLALRGVPSIVLERRERGKPFHLRTNMTNVRSMEHFRRWGMADALRKNDPVPEDIRRDVSFVTRLNGHLILNLPRTYEWSEPLPFASEVAEWAPNEGIEKTMWGRVAELPLIDHRNENEVATFAQDDDGVSVEVKGPDGTPYTIRGDYLVLCDGSRGNLRRILNVRHEGRTLAMSLSWHFRSKQLKELWSAGPAVSMVYFYNEDRGSDLITAQGPETWQYFAGPTPAGVGGDDWEQVKELIFNAVGQEIDVEPLSGGAFAENSLLVPRLDLGRIMLAGDAAPHGLAPGRLRHELRHRRRRRPRLEACRAHSGLGRAGAHTVVLDRPARGGPLHPAGLRGQPRPWRYRAGPGRPRGRGPEGEAVKQDILERKLVQSKRMGGQLGYRYSASPLIVRDGTERDLCRLHPVRRAQLPRPSPVAGDGSSLYDHFGLGFTLLDPGGIDATELLKRAQARGIPIEIFRPDEVDRESLLGMYERRAALVRSDHHVAWRGDELPAQIEHLLDIVTGHALWGRLVTGSKVTFGVDVDAERERGMQVRREAVGDAEVDASIARSTLFNAPSSIT